MEQKDRFKQPIEAYIKDLEDEVVVCMADRISGFVDGMIKQRNSVWHKVKEEVPTDFGASILVLCRNKNKEDGIFLADLIQCWEGEYKPRENWEDPIMWAYLSDLFPSKEQNQ